MNKLVAVTQLALCFVFVFCNSEGSGTMSSQLVGHWVYGIGDPNMFEKLELFKDGTGVTSKNTISWKVEDKRLVILSSNFGRSCDYKISGNALTLINDDGDSAIFVRKGKLEEFKAEQAAKADSRDNKTYKYVTIGSQTWMAENLNYAAEGSKCYKNNDSNCEKYGRLYTWADAKKACPWGWHLPTNAEWTTLVNYVENADGCNRCAGTKLKSTSGWSKNGNGTDDYGFSALPGGYGYSDGYFYDAGYYGFWWSATEGNAYYA